MAFESGNELGLIHGHTVGGVNGGKSREYQSWTNMVTRCKSDPKYVDKGIQVCERWLVFENFLADMGERPPGTSLDRVDGALGYFKENCRWATPSEQRKNQNAPRGNRARYHHLTKEIWEKIHALYNAGWTQKDVSNELDVPIGIVGRVVRGERDHD